MYLSKMLGMSELEFHLEVKLGVKTAAQRREKLLLQLLSQCTDQVHPSLTLPVAVAISFQLPHQWNYNNPQLRTVVVVEA
jgi:hypothetical protein